MSFIDWSDSDAMFGLLVEYVADAQSAETRPRRRALLSRLRSELESLQDGFEEIPAAEAIAGLRTIRESIDSELESDDVVEHLAHCIEELERVNAA